MSSPAPEVGPVGPWPVRVVAVTGSTNADLADLARRGRRDPQVLVARSQTAGRGRLGRAWASPPEDSVSLSLLWAPAVAPGAWPWLPMVVGLGVLDAVASFGVVAGLKWPNDVVVPAPSTTGADARDPVTGALTGLAKLAGILCEAVGTPAGPVLVAGVGVNLRRPGGPAGDRAAGLAGLLGGEGPGFAATAAALARDVPARLLAWERAGGDVDVAGLRADYRAACTTLGRQVHVSTPGGARSGLAVDVADDGALVLRVPGGPGPGAEVGVGTGAEVGAEVRVQAGDVEHVR